MAAQGFLLIASFLLVLFIIARPLGFGLARLINNTSLPGGWRGTSALARSGHLAAGDELAAVSVGDPRAQCAGVAGPVFNADGAKPAAAKSATATGFRGIWRSTRR